MIGVAARRARIVPRLQVSRVPARVQRLSKAPSTPMRCTWGLVAVFGRSIVTDTFWALCPPMLETATEYTPLWSTATVGVVTVTARSDDEAAEAGATVSARAERASRVRAWRCMVVPLSWGPSGHDRARPIAALLRARDVGTRASSWVRWRPGASRGPESVGRVSALRFALGVTRESACERPRRQLASSSLVDARMDLRGPSPTIPRISRGSADARARSGARGRLVGAHIRPPTA